MNYCFVFGHEPWLLPPALEMVEILKRNGHSVNIIYAQYTGAQPELKDYDPAYTFEVIEKGGRRKHYFKHKYLAASFKKLQAQKAIDVVIACDIISLQAIVSVSTTAKTAYWCFEEPKGKKVLSLDYYRIKRLGKWINKLSLLIMPSPTREKRLKEKYAISIPSVVVYNCRQYKPEARNKIKDIPHFDTLCVYTGKISATQYVSEIIDAVGQVKGNTGLVIAGPADTAYLEEIKKKIAGSHQLKQRIVLLGRITRDEVYDLIAMADIGFVLYGLDVNGNEIDPAPNKLGDYVAGNTWIVGSGQAYLKYWLHDKQAGVCVNTINKDTLAGAIEAIQKGEQFSNTATLQKLYEEELNMGAQYEKMQKIINTL